MVTYDSLSHKLFGCSIRRQLIVTCVCASEGQSCDRKKQKNEVDAPLIREFGKDKNTPALDPMDKDQTLTNCFVYP